MKGMPITFHLSYQGPYSSQTVKFNLGFAEYLSSREYPVGFENRDGNVVLASHGTRMA